VKQSTEQGKGRLALHAAPVTAMPHIDPYINTIVLVDRTIGTYITQQSRPLQQALRLPVEMRANLWKLGMGGGGLRK
jgi:hypothetical protein